MSVLRKTPFLRYSGHAHILVCGSTELRGGQPRSARLGAWSVRLTAKHLSSSLDTATHPPPPPPNLLLHLQLGIIFAETLLLCKNGDDGYPFVSGQVGGEGEMVLLPEPHINEGPHI